MKNIAGLKVIIEITILTAFFILLFNISFQFYSSNSFQVFACSDFGKEWEEIERGPSPKEGQQPQFFGYEGQKYFPHGVVVDSSGNIFVAEAPPKHSIIKFNGDGNFVEKWG